MVFEIYTRYFYRPKVTTSSLVGILTLTFLRSTVGFKCEQLQTSSPNHLILNCDSLRVLSNTVTTCPLHSGLSGIKYGNGTSTCAKPSWTFIRENPNSTFALITEIFGGITSNFHGLSQITALSKLPQITRY